MSTLNFNKGNFSSTPPIWAHRIPEHHYHAEARAGKVVSASTLREFRRCPSRYHALVNGLAETESSGAFRLGRALHKLVLEGEGAYRGAFVVGGPFNDVTGRSFGHGTRAFDRWARDCGVDPARVVTHGEEAVMRRMLSSVRRHGEAARLLAFGWPELSVRSEVESLPCQARLDWLGEGGAVDLKTVADLSRFEENARRFGYLHQFAFYRDVVRAAGGGELEIAAVVVEKRVPHRVGVWRFPPAVLEPYAVQNRLALQALRKCREQNHWPTGYEGTRAFPPAGLPPLWLN